MRQLNKRGMETWIWVTVAFLIAVITLLIVLGFQIGASEMIDKLLGGMRF